MVRLGGNVTTQPPVLFGDAPEGAGSPWLLEEQAAAEQAAQDQQT